MPTAAPTPCRQPGCAALVSDGGWCDRHRRARQRDYDRDRGSAASRGYDGRWRRYRIAYLSAHPLCAICRGEGRVTEATVVDHVVPHKGDRKLFWKPANHQPACKPCHDRKTALEDGRWGSTNPGAAAAARGDR